MRLVSLTPSNTEIVYALGLEHLLVGVDDYSDFPPEVCEALPKVGPDLQVDLDRVEALEPDLALASLSVPGMERIVEGLERRGVRHVALNPHSLEQVLADVERVGELTGHGERGRETAGDLRQRLADVERYCRRAGEPRVRRLFWEWWPRPLITPGKRSWINDVCALVGAENVFADLDVTSRPVRDQEVFERDPDAVCMCWCGTLQKAMDAKRVRARAGWEALRAVRGDDIYALPEDLFGRPGPRLVEGAAMLAGVLYQGRNGDERA